MERGEKLRTILCFALFAVLVLLLFLRLSWLQGSRAAANRASVRLSRNVVDALPAPRGSILDRFGRRLAYDRPVLTVRAEFQARVGKGEKRIPGHQIDFLATRLAGQLMAGSGQTGSRSGLRARLHERMARARHRLLPSNYKTVDYLQVEFLVARDLDSFEAIRRLREEAHVWRSKADLPGRLHLRFIRGYKRTYPEREFTYGPVGSFYVASRKAVRVRGRTRQVAHEVHTGLESCAGLWPEEPTRRGGRSRCGPDYYTIDFRDSKRRRFWSGLGAEPEAASFLKSTLDLDLQKQAHLELRAAAAAVAAEPRYRSSYEWGAMVLVEIESGEVLALASHYPGRKTPAPFAPVENCFEPGSVVKPLVIALALERGRVHWNEEIDCTPTQAGLGRPVLGFPGRIIRDDHCCGLLRPHGIIVNSSNIGAVTIGARLGRDGMKEYLNRYGFLRRTGLGLRNEALGRRGLNPSGTAGIAAIDKLPDRVFGRYTAPSLSFGYELDVTAVQLARAYLNLLAGRERQLRLAKSAGRAGQKVLTAVGDQSQPRFLSKDTVDKVFAAMIDVVSSDEHATGRHLYEMLGELGHPQPLIAGKTGTSISGIGDTQKRTAVFVGIAPVDAPRYLAVCVLRKDRAARFYGGSYAAPPAGRLLLRALALQQEVRRARDEQVSAWDGDGVRTSEKK